MKNKQIIPSNKVVKKSNALARARWGIESVWEPRLVALLASKIRRDDDDFKVYKIHISELLQSTSGSRGGQDYRIIEQTIDRVMSRVLTIRNNKGWVKYNVFSYCSFQSDNGILELGFHPDLKPHYLELKRHFCQYNLIEFLSLPSIYSQRLFEILKSWQDQIETIILLEELYAMLDVSESLRSRYPDFRRKVLEKAHKDITTLTELYYEWEPIKKGRKVTAIRFVFAKNKTQKLAKKKQQKAQKTSSCSGQEL